MTRRISFYLLKEMATPFFLSLLALSFVLLMDKIMRLTELVVNKGVPAAYVGQLLLFLLPGFLVYAIPAAVLLATLLAFGRLSSDMEITALKAAGISLYQLLPPVLAFGLAAATVAGILSLFVAPLNNMAFKGLLFKITKSKASLGIKERVFNRDFQDLTIYVDKVSHEGQIFKGVMVSDQRQEDNSNIIIAEQGYLVLDERNLALILRLENGSVHRSSQDLQLYRKLDFASYELRLNLDQVLANSRRKGKRLSEMALEELRDRIKTLREEGRYSRLYKAEVELYQKIAFPVAAFVFALLGMPLGIQSRRAGRLSGFSLGLGILFLSYLLLAGGKQLALAGLMPASVSLSLGNLLYLAVAIYLLVTTAHEKDLWLTGKLGLALESVGKLFNKLRTKL